MSRKANWVLLLVAGFAVVGVVAAGLIWANRHNIWPGPPPVQIVEDIYAKAVKSVDKLKLMNEYTRVPGTNILLRLPEGCHWDKKTKRFNNAECFVSISGSLQLEKSLEQAREAAKEFLKQRASETLPQEDVQIDKLAGMFYQVKSTDPADSFRDVYLVIGDDKNHVRLRFVGPKSEGAVKLGKECFLTARWGDDLVTPYIESLPYKVEAAEGFQLSKMTPKLRGLVFAPTGNLVPGASVQFDIGLYSWPGAKDRKKWFAEFINNPPSYIKVLGTDYLEPVGAGTLKGYEAVSLASGNIVVPPSFYYRAVLFLSDEEAYQFVGSGPTADRAQYEPKFKQMVRSFQLN